MKDTPGQGMNVIFCGVLPDCIKLTELPTQGVILKQLSQKAAFHSSQLISLFWSSGAKEPPNHLMLTVRSLWVQFRLRLQWSLGMVISRHPRYIAIRYIWSLSFHGEKNSWEVKKRRDFSPPLKQSIYEWSINKYEIARESIHNVYMFHIITLYTTYFTILSMMAQ